jgi:hypothetical protein
VADELLSLGLVLGTVGRVRAERKEVLGCGPVLPENGLGLPDFALVAETVFDDETGLGLDPGLLERALGRLVGLVVLAWVSHD